MVARVSWRHTHVSREASRRRRNGRGEGGWTSPANSGGICGRRQTGERQAAVAVRETEVLEREVNRAWVLRPKGQGRARFR
jgi:hypothetical protein